MNTKICNKCGKCKDVDLFYKRKDRVNTSATCKKCFAEHRKEDREKNPEKYREWKKIWYENNKDLSRDQCKRWRENNVDKHRECSKKWRDNNIERHRENAKNWAKSNLQRASDNKKRNMEKNPDRYEKYHKEYREQRKEEKKDYNKQYYESNREKFFRSNAKRRAVKRDQMHPEHDLIIEKNLYDTATQLGEKCGNKYHVDHIWPLAKGGPHHHDNLQVITGDINLEKNDSILFRHPDIKTWCELPDHILKWVKENKRENFDKVVKQVIKRKKHSDDEIQRIVNI